MPALPGGPSAGRPPALPSGPVIGTGYSGTGYGHPPAAGPTVYGTPPAEPIAPPAPQPIAELPAGPAFYGPPSTGFTASTSVYGAPPSTAYTEATALHPNVVTQAPVPEQRRESRPRRGKTDECAALRAECEQLREIAANVQAAAVQAALDAQTAHADFLTAQRTAEEARRAHELVVREADQVAAEIAQLGPVGTPTASDAERERMQAETSHAAFAAYRRGDITSEQLREVFKRAEGWTPEHDRLAKRQLELRTEEADTARAREAALLAADEAGEQARTAAINARTLDDQARTAAVDARGRCAAADACEQRNRR